MDQKTLPTNDFVRVGVFSASPFVASMLAVLFPKISVKSSVTDGLLEVVGSYFGFVFKIGDGTCHFEDAVVCSRA